MKGLAFLVGTIWIFWMSWEWLRNKNINYCKL